MKRNVDLTESMIFSRNSWVNRIINIDDFTWGMISGARIPWKIDFKIMDSEDELDMNYQRKSLIALGNREMRAEIKLLREMDEMKNCDRCGDKLDKIPWDRQIGLCKRCNDDFEKQFNDKCKWRIKEEIRNAVIRIA